MIDRVQSHAWPWLYEVDILKIKAQATAGHKVVSLFGALYTGNMHV